MTAHKWKDSTLGHGEMQCEYCLATNREIAVTGDLNNCPDAPDDKVFEPCDTCEGTGECVDCMGEGDEDCPTCAGSGVCEECIGTGEIYK